VNPNAKLKSVNGSPFADGQTAPCWVEISHDGRYLFAVNTGSTSISSYRILSNGSLRNLTSTPVSSGVGIRPFDARLDVAGDYLYVVDAAIASVSGFAVSGGSLTEVASSPTALPTGATPFGIAIVTS
jgi:6-phosphogluconolactonase